MYILLVQVHTTGTLHILSNGFHIDIGSYSSYNEDEEGTETSAITWRSISAIIFKI